jgi:hypothetical protein
MTDSAIGAIAHPLPQFLGQERHDRMQQAQRARQHIVHHLQHLRLARLVGAVERLLGVFHVPVAELVPEEFVDRLGVVVEAAAVDVLVAGAIVLCSSARMCWSSAVSSAGSNCGSRHVHRRSPVCICRKRAAFQIFVPKLRPSSNFLLGNVDILPGRRQRDQAEAQRVRAEIADDVERVDRVAQALAHLAALVVAHGAVQVDAPERHVAHELEAGHDHARHPEEDDLRRRDQVARRIEELQVRVVLRPAEHAERPQPRAEPRVEHVRILPELVGPAPRALRRLPLGGPFVLAVRRLAIEHRNAVPPPDLAADAPVADVLHPVEIHLVPALGHEAHAAVLDRLDGRPGQRLHLHEPLRRQPRLDHRVAAVAVPHRVRVVVDLHQQARRLQVGHDLLAALFAVEPLVRARVLVHLAGPRSSR